MALTGQPRVAELVPDWAALFSLTRRWLANWATSVVLGLEARWRRRVEERDETGIDAPVLLRRVAARCTDSGDCFSWVDSSR